MVNILHVSFGGLDFDGVSNVILSIVKKLPKDDYSCDCVVFKKHGSQEQEFIKYGRLHRINCYYPPSTLSYYIDILTRPLKMAIGAFILCKNQNYDVIHCHNGHEAIYFVIGARLAGVKKRIVHSHNNLPTNNSILKNAIDYFHRLMISFIATDQIGCSEKACKSFFIKPNWMVIHNPIDLSIFSWQRKRHNGIKFIHIGRFTHQKNQTFLLEIFYHISYIFQDVSLDLLGWGEDEMEIVNRINELHLDGKVNIINGRNKDIHDFLSYADYMIFPSHHEGFGISLLEAQATGCYCFASDCIPKEVDIGAITWISLSLSASEWANIICKYISEDTGFQHIPSKALDKFGINEIISTYESIYDI